MTTDAPRPRRRRWWWRSLAVVLVVAAAAVAALPWALSSAPARRWMLARANRALAPGGLTFASFRPSWFGPTVLTDVALIDDRGERVLAAPRVTCDRTLFQILFDRPRFGTVVLHEGALDVERLPDGRIDLYEVLRPLFRGNPAFDLKVRVERGSVRFRSPGLAEPVEAPEADLALDIPAAPGALAWSVDLSWPATGDGEAPRRLELRGELDRWRAKPGQPADLTATLAGRRWPLAVEARGVAARGLLDGDLALTRRASRWASRGDATLLDVEASGGPIAGDRPRFERLAAAWNLEQSGVSWRIGRLDLDSPFGTLRAGGTWPATADGPVKVEGRIDLPALAAALPATLRLREGLAIERGRVELDAEARPGDEPGAVVWTARAALPELKARDGDRAFELNEPARFEARAISGDGGFRLEELTARTSFLEATGRGDLDRGIDVTGELDLAALGRRLGDFVDLGDVDLGGQALWTGHYRRAGDRFEGGFRADLDDASLGGRRGSFALTARVDGAAGPDGLPDDWSEARVDLTGGDWTAGARARPEDGPIVLDLHAAGPLRVGGSESRFEAAMAGVWEGRDLEIRTARLASRSEDVPLLELAARGRYDGQADELVLEPLATVAPPAVTLTTDGLTLTGLRSGGPWRAEVGLVGDAGALDRHLAGLRGEDPVGLDGPWDARLSARGGADEGTTLSGRVAYGQGPPADPGPDDGYRFDWGVRVADGGDRADVDELVLVAPFGRLEVDGRVTDLRGRRVADLRGELVPDWDWIQARLVERVDPEALVAGRSRPFRLSGPLSAGSLDELAAGLEGEVGVDVTAARIHGLSVGPAAVVLRAQAGRLGLAPIDTTLNEGRLRVETEIDLDEETGPSVRLTPGTSLDEAVINDEVSRRFLAFVAPVLAEATRVTGRVSAAIRDAEFPIGDSPGRKARVEGTVTFDDVEFTAGPLADELFDLIGPDRAPRLRLDEPVRLNIADGRVHQTGLAIPIGGLSRVEVEGWVDFDRNMALTASLPVTPALLANNALLSDIAAGTRVSLPIRGTLSRPQVDREALVASLKDLGKTLLRRGAVRGAAELLFRLSRPRDPDAPPPPPRLTPEERRQQRREAKEERRRRRAGDN